MELDEKQKIKEYKQRYYLKNRERLIIKSREYYYENKEQIIKQHLIYKKKNIKIIKTKKVRKTKNAFYYKNKKQNNFNFFVNCMFKKMIGRVNGKAKERYKGLEICSREEFLNLALNNKYLKNIYANWQNSSYQFRLIPTVDRIDNARGYAIDNIQFLTFSDNARKGDYERWQNSSFKRKAGD